MLPKNLKQKSLTAMSRQVLRWVSQSFNKKIDHFLHCVTLRCTLRNSAVYKIHFRFSGVIKFAYSTSQNFPGKISNIFFQITFSLQGFDKCTANDCTLSLFTCLTETFSVGNSETN